MTNTLKKIIILTTIFFSIIFTTSTSFAADTAVEMLNKKGKETMVFSLKIVKINVGEKVFWKATNKGHNVEFIKKHGIPKGVEKFKSRLSKDAQYTFKVPGIYAYWCTPHKAMGMIGFVVVGNDKSNIESIKKVKFRGKSKKRSLLLINEIENK